MLTSTHLPYLAATVFHPLCCLLHWKKARDLSKGFLTPALLLFHVLAYTAVQRLLVMGLTYPPA